MECFGISAKAGKVVSGTDLVLECLEKKNIFLVIVAEDASEKTLKNMKYSCEKNNTEIVVYGTIFENSKAIGKPSRAIIGITDKKLAEVIKKQIQNKQN